MSALSLGRSPTVTITGANISTAPGGGSIVPSEHTKLSPTNSLQCPRSVKSPIPQNSISVRDLFPHAVAAQAKAALAAASAGPQSPPQPPFKMDHCNNSNHLPAVRSASTPGGQQLNNFPPNTMTSPRIRLSQLSPVSSTDESYRRSHERLYIFFATSMLLHLCTLVNATGW